jgi:hypothetical protein
MSPFCPFWDFRRGRSQGANSGHQRSTYLYSPIKNPQFAARFDRLDNTAAFPIVFDHITHVEKAADTGFYRFTFSQCHLPRPLDGYSKERRTRTARAPKYKVHCGEDPAMPQPVISRKSSTKASRAVINLLRAFQRAIPQGGAKGSILSLRGALALHRRASAARWLL